MIVTYESKFSEGDRPRLCKVVQSEVDETDRVVTTLTLSNTEEINIVNDDIMWEYMSMLLMYLKQEISSLKLTEQGVFPDEGWPVIGWPRIQKLNDEITSWWSYLTYKDEPVEVIHNV
jgi:hypothetical protein